MISDKKLGINTTTPVSAFAIATYFTADVKSAGDYYSFGMQMGGRTFSASDYRFGFQRQETEQELWGGQASFFKYRISDNRLGRFFSVDPLTGFYPWNSPYAFSENRVTNANKLLYYENWDNYFNFTKDALLYWDKRFASAIQQTIDKGGKIIFRLDGVDISKAKTGYGSYKESDKLKEITEWELSQILRNSEWLKNTVFMRGEKIVDATKEGLETIK